METALLAGTLASGATIALALSVFHVLGGARAGVNRRIQTFIKGSAPQVARVADTGGGKRARTAGAVAAAESHNRLVRYLEGAIESAQADLTPREVLIACAVSGLVVAGLVALVTVPPLGIPAAIAGAYLPILWLRRRAGSLASRFRKQLADTVSLLASAVRAGNALPRAFERVGVEAPEPTRSAFRAAVREMGLGATLEDALDRLVERYPSEDMELLVASINVQYQVGGNLTRVLDLIAETLRERQRVLGDIRSLTSQQRYSAYLLSALPVVVTAGLYFVSPDYISILFTGAFRLLLVLVVVLILSGFFIMQQLAKIDV